MNKQELINELDNLCRRLQDDYNGKCPFVQSEEDRIAVYDTIEYLENLWKHELALGEKE